MFQFTNLVPDRNKFLLEIALNRHFKNFFIFDTGSADTIVYGADYFKENKSEYDLFQQYIERYKVKEHEFGSATDTGFTGYYTIFKNVSVGNVLFELFGCYITFNMNKSLFGCDISNYCTYTHINNSNIIGISNIDMGSYANCVKRKFSEESGSYVSPYDAVLYCNEFGATATLGYTEKNGSQDSCGDSDEKISFE